MKKLLWLGIFWVVACTTERKIPADAVIRCTKDDDCPEKAVCDVVSQTCLPQATPLVRVRGPADQSRRYTRVVPVSVDLVSAEVSTDFAITLEFAVEDPSTSPELLSWHPMTLATGSQVARPVRASIGGASFQFQWDALADAIAENGLSMTRVDVDGNGQVADPIVQTETVRLRAWATSVDGALSSSVAVSDPFNVGNLAPTATIQDVLGDSGLISIVVGLTDTSGDSCGFEVEFRGFDNLWRKAALPFGTTNGLSCSVSVPLETLVSWDSRASYLADVTQLGTPQGIGNTNVPFVDNGQVMRVQLRARAYDAVEATTSEQHWGTWSPPWTPPQINNQTPPLISDVQAPRPVGAPGTSPIHIAYQLYDEESDPVDMLFEFSNDHGTTWQLCKEFGYIFSEGTTGLLTAPRSTGGISHLFSWDPSGLSPINVNATLLRLTAVGAANRTTMAPFTLARVAGSSGAAPHAAFWQEQFQGPVHQSNGTTQSCCVESVVVADFNNDNVKDVVVAKPADTTMSLFLNNGSLPWTELQLAGTVESLISADFTGDGNADLLGLDATGSGALWRGNGNGTFTLDTNLSFERADLLLTGDFNNDGRVDLVSMVATPDYSTWPLRVYLNSGVAGSRFGSSSYSLSSSTNFALTLGDLDKDGNLDLALANNGTGSVLLGNGDGTFSNGPDLLPPAPLSVFADFDRQNFAAGDFNGDGILDIINPQGNGFVYLQGVLNASTLSYNYFEVDFSDMPDGRILVRDMNRDGLDDFLASDALSLRIGVFFAALDSNQQVQFHGGELVGFGYSNGIALDDLENDGSADLILAENGNAELHIYSQDYFNKVGSTYSTLGAQFESNGVPVVGHFDSDGVLDLLFVVRGSSGFSITLMRGSSQSGTDGFGFNAPVTQFVFFSESVFPETVQALDVNSDGVDDLVFIGNSDGGSPQAYFGWMENTFYQGVVDGRFSTPTFFQHGQLVNGGSRSLAAGDFDQDGYTDVAWLVNSDAAGSSYEIAVSFNDPSVGYQQVDASYALPNPGVLQVADLNADGKPDLSVLIGGSDLIRIFRSSSGVTNRANPFPSTQDVAVGFSTNGQQILDLNNDGILDIVGFSSVSFTSYLGQLAGTFAAGVDHVFNASVQRSFFSDATNDGFADLNVLNSDGQPIGEVWVAQAPNAIPNMAFEDVGARFDLPNYYDDLQVQDLNCDGVEDWIYSRSEMVQFAMGSRDSVSPGLQPVATNYVSTGRRAVRTLGITGVAPPVAWYPATGVLCHGGQDWASSLRALRRSLGLSARYRMLGPPHFAGDTVRFQKVRVGDDVRLRRFARFAGGLDLLNGTRGLIFSLPVYRGLQSGLTAPAIRVFRQTLVLPNASQYSADVLHSDALAPELLPQVVNTRGPQDVAVRNFVWEQVPRDADGNLTTGSGARFIYDAVAGTVDILTDSGGLYIATQDQ